MSNAIVRPIRSLARRDRATRRIVSEAAFIVTAVRVALTVVPYTALRRMRGFVLRVASWLSKPSRDPQELAAAVRIASRHVPNATCLTQALALHFMMARRGIASRVTVGVAQRNGRLAAHAWIDQDGVVLIGGDVTPYHPLRRADERIT
ncbi:MAG: lasso peptide biosynthesis B2 protein [bacterium]|nr:lasso peptide biosynthesis B2 protein [Candidatus Kapabacteria bacterium]